uniref:Uncharacterized protein n=1 Tax=Salix viminalis TaxID=40686 RepID=A0A6N2KWV7_SALVM
MDLQTTYRLKCRGRRSSSLSSDFLSSNNIFVEMKFLDWYVKISAGGALIGASMELFMIKTGFCMTRLLFWNQRSGLGKAPLKLRQSEKL